MVLISPNYSDYWQTPETYVNRFEDYITNAVSTEEGINHSEELLKEALAVSASLVPVYWLTSKALRRLTVNWSPESAVLLNVAVSAGLFHIICEETGVNNWYLSNSIASKKAQKKYKKKHQSSFVSVEAPSSCQHNFNIQV
jgi:hypothetical protein